jgi:hypothetical protein
MTTILNNIELNITQDGNQRESKLNKKKKKPSVIIEFEDSETVYIKHKDNTHIYEIPYTAAKHSKLLYEFIIDTNPNESYGKIMSNPFIINIQNSFEIFSLEFIVKYMKFYDNKKETLAPEAPIKHLHISLIIGDDYILFDNIYNINDTLKEKIIKLNDIIVASLYFGIKHLHKKLSAITASLLINLDIDELKKLI